MPRPIIRSHRLTAVLVPVVLASFVSSSAAFAQECLGLHQSRSGTVSEITIQRQPTFSGLGLGVSRRAVFGLVETATDPVTGGDLFSLKRSSLTLGAQKQQDRLSLCAGVNTRRDQLEETPSVKSTAVGGLLAVGYRIVDAESPVIVFAQAQLESRRDEVTGGLLIPTDREIGTGLRLGAAYRYEGWLGARSFIDVRSAGSTLGASLSLTIPRRELAPDGDGDGVPDAADTCPNTPAGARVNADGCQPDADGDGVPDATDTCPNTPAGARVNADGCQPDADGDGVPDATDKCPNTPAGARVNADGCEPDADGDGVPDSRDKCANTLAGVTVDADGCPPISDQGPIRLDGVTFAIGAANLTPTSLVKLDELAEALTQRTNLRIEISGHADNTGAAVRNDALSLARAGAVRTYLIRRGIAAERLEARGYGSREPVAPNTTAEGRAQNRRVEAKRID